MPISPLAEVPRSRSASADLAYDTGHSKRADSARAVEFGIYRDGDNNLDEAQHAVIDQAQRLSARDPEVAFNVEDETSLPCDAAPGGELHTDQFAIEDGRRIDVHASGERDMASRSTLTRFVASTLDHAESDGAATTWLDLVDHGGGDGGAFQTSASGGGVMSEDDIAGAIADGVRAHARAHPEDAGRKVDGVVMNACLMATLGMETALSHAGVAYLAASPETMIAPGAPSTVAADVARLHDDPAAMAQAMVDRTMDQRYGPTGERFGPAAAFDVFDLAPSKIAGIVRVVKTLDDALSTAAGSPASRAAIRQDARETPGMTRSQERDLPWHADRPAEALYGALASDTRLSASVRNDALVAEQAVAATVLAHGESRSFAPFDGASYRDAAGPTVHFPISPGQIDPWAPAISETDNAFYDAVDAGKLSAALA